MVASREEYGSDLCFEAKRRSPGETLVPSTVLRCANLGHRAIAIL